MKALLAKISLPISAVSGILAVYASTGQPVPLSLTPAILAWAWLGALAVFAGIAYLDHIDHKPTT